MAAHHRAWDEAAKGTPARWRLSRALPPEDRPAGEGALPGAAAEKAVTGRRLRAEVEAVTGVRVADVKRIACCAGASEDEPRRLPSR